MTTFANLQEALIQIAAPLLGAHEQRILTPGELQRLLPAYRDSYIGRLLSRWRRNGEQYFTGNVMLSANLEYRADGVHRRHVLILTRAEKP